MRSKSQILSKLRADGHITDEEYNALEQEPCDDAIGRQAVPDIYEDIAKAFQFGLAFGFGKKHDEMDKIINEIKKVITPHPKTGCEGCKYEKTGNNSIYPCNHCGRCYMDKYKAESEG